MAQILEHDPLVQRVLVDDHHPFAGLDDKVAIVHLDRLGSRSVAVVGARQGIRGIMGTGVSLVGGASVGFSTTGAENSSKASPEPLGATFGSDLAQSGIFETAPPA